MDIKIAREVAARIWGDAEMAPIEFDVGLAEEIAQLITRRLDRAALCKQDTRPILHQDPVTGCVRCDYIWNL